MSSKTNKISQKAKYEKYEKTMYLVYLYLEKKGLENDFKYFCAEKQGEKVVVPSKMEIVINYIKNWWKK